MGIMYNRNLNIQNKLLYIEHALRNIHNKKHDHRGCAKKIENIALKYVDEEKRLDFLDELLRIIINPGQSSDIKGKCELIEQALYEHFNKKNYSRYYGDATVIQRLTHSYIEEEKQSDFLDALLDLIQLKKNRFN